MQNDGLKNGELLASRRIKAGTRHYYIDAKSDSKGAHYIVLSETRAREDGTKGERHRVFIYEEDFAKVSAALLEMMSAAAKKHAPVTAASAVEDEREELELQQINISWDDDEA